jgi:hypothetical protein
VARLCIFCGAPAEEPEPAIAAWIPRYLKQKHLILLHAQANNVTYREKIPFANYKARIICIRCNRHFAKLEDAVRPLLVPMLDGVSRSYDRSEQDLIVRWAFKTTCALLGVERKPRAVPQSQRRMLRSRGVVPQSTFVGLGRYSGGGVRIFAGRLKLVPGRGVPEDKVLSVYHSVTAFGQFVCKVFGVLKAPPEDTFRIPVGRLHRFWPPRDDLITWPPLWGLDDDEVDELAVFNPFIRR